MPAKKDETLELAAPLEALTGRTDEEKRVLGLAVTLPAINARIDRKINMGNYESLGIGISVYRPIGLSDEDWAIYEGMAKDALKDAYNLAATEMNMRVDRIKARAKGEEA